MNPDLLYVCTLTKNELVPNLIKYIMKIQINALCWNGQTVTEHKDLLWFIQTQERHLFAIVSSVQMYSFKYIHI